MTCVRAPAGETPGAEEVGMLSALAAVEPQARA